MDLYYGGQGVWSAYLGLHQPAPQPADLLEVAEDVEHPVLLAQLDVGVDHDVHAGAARAVTGDGEEEEGEEREEEKGEERRRGGRIGWPGGSQN